MISHKTVNNSTFPDPVLKFSVANINLYPAPVQCCTSLLLNKIEQGRNPFSGFRRNSQITIEASRSELTVMKLYDVFGREVSASIGITDQTESKRIIDISQLPDGVYTLKTLTLVTKLIKH